MPLGSKRRRIGFLPASERSAPFLVAKTRSTLIRVDPRDQIKNGKAFEAVLFARCPSEKACCLCLYRQGIGLYDAKNICALR